MKPTWTALPACSGLLLAAFAATASLSYAQDKKTAPVTPANYAESKEWPTYGHDSGGMRYSPLTQITPANVSNLKVAWTYHLKPADYVAAAGDGMAAMDGLAPAAGKAVQAGMAAEPGVVVSDAAAEPVSALLRSRRSW